MKAKYLLLAIGTLLLVSSITAQAQSSAPTSSQPQVEKVQDISPEKRALIKEFLEAIDIKKTSRAVFDATFNQMMQRMPETMWEAISASKDVQQMSGVEQQRLRDALKERTVLIAQKMKERLTQRLDFDQMMEDISTQIYAKYFNETELKDIIAFYKSQTGKRTLEVMPNLFAESMSASYERMSPILKDLETEITRDEAAKLDEMVTDILKSHHTTPARRGKTRKSQPKGNY
jgi:uncharacterized protein